MIGTNTMKLPGFITDRITDEFDSIFDEIDEWVVDYRGSADYWEDYCYIVWEGGTVNDSMEKLIESGYGGISIPEQHRQRFAENLLESGLIECIMADEYATGPDGSLDSLHVSEEEEQILLDTIRDRVTSRWIRWFFNRALDYYVKESNRHCLRGSPMKEDNILMYVMIGKRAHYVVSAETFAEAYTEYVIDSCRNQ